MTKSYQHFFLGKVIKHYPRALEGLTVLSHGTTSACMHRDVYICSKLWRAVKRAKAGLKWCGVHQALQSRNKCETLFWIWTASLMWHFVQQTLVFRQGFLRCTKIDQFDFRLPVRKRGILFAQQRPCRRWWRGCLRPPRSQCQWDYQVDVRFPAECLAKNITAYNSGKANTQFLQKLPWTSGLNVDHFCLFR